MNIRHFFFISKGESPLYQTSLRYLPSVWRLFTKFSALELSREPCFAKNKITVFV
jgi:hypothetical protein